MTLKEIKNKLENDEYQCFEDYLADCKTIDLKLEPLSMSSMQSLASAFSKKAEIKKVKTS